jgi:hypothetical protein
MTKEQKFALLENRLLRLMDSPKNIKSNGVVRKLTRQYNHMKKELGLA